MLQNILSIFHVPQFYNELHLVDALFVRTQTSFGIGQTVYFSFINRNVSIKHTTHMVHHFPIQLFANGGI